MHDNATHNGNATHDDAKIMMLILTLKVMLMMLMLMMKKSYYVVLTIGIPKAVGKSFSLNQMHLQQSILYIL